MFNSSHYGGSNLSPSNLNLGLSGSISPTGSNMSACMVQTSPGVSTGMTGHHHITPHSPTEAKSGYPYLGSHLGSQVCGTVH